jgi:hypothetical protein
MKLTATRTLIVGGAVLALGLGGGVAIADIPSSTDGTVAACLLKPGVAIRLINARADARRSTPPWSRSSCRWLRSRADGSDGVSGYEVVQRTNTTTVGGALTFSSTIECPAGKVATGGGATAFHFAVFVADDNPLVISPATEATGWAASWARNGGRPFADNYELTYRIFAICVNAR